MKIAYILFSKQQPNHHKMILDLIIHFCWEHSLTYRLHPDDDDNTITIEGYDYRINLLKINDGSEPPYWMIYCSLINKRNSHVNHTAA